MKKFLLGILLCSFGITVNAQTYVNANATGANNGTSWANAYTDLHSATYNTTSGEIWVAQGTYVPSKTFTNNIPGNNSLKTFRVQFNVQVYGGFNGTETALNQRDWKNNPTILSGDVGAGLKAYNIVRFDGNNNTTIFDGFIVQDGRANGTSEQFGGAIFSTSASPIIRNCKFINNNAQQHGGAVYISGGATPQVLNCEFSNNTTTQYDGGALYINGVTNTIVANCLFNGNTANRYAGAVVIQNTNTSQVNNCTFVNNQRGTGGTGRALFLSASVGSPVMSVNNCVFYNNLPIGGDDVNRNGSSSYTVNNSYSDAGNAGFTNSGTLTNILSGNPFFTDFDNDDFTLQCKSALVNSGSTSGLTIPATDLDGNIREFGTAIDMGAYENVITTIGIDASKTSICNGDFVILNGTCDPTGYSWDNGVANGIAFYPTATQTYTCTGLGTATTEQITITVLNFSDENVNGPNSVCYNTSATVSIPNSANGAQYFLKDNATDVIIDGPVTGNGSAINFTTNNITATKTYAVVGANNYNISPLGALDFDGVNDHINAGSASRSISTQISIAAWIKTTASGTNQFIVSKYTGSLGYLLIINTTGKVQIDGRDGSGTYKSSGPSITSVNDGMWHYVVGTVNLAFGQWKIYVDGVLEAGVTNTPGTGINAATNLLFGAYSTFLFNGSIDEITLWNTELNLATIQANMNASLTGSESGVVGHFKFNEGNGATSVVDYSVSATNGVLTNMDPATDWVTGRGEVLSVPTTNGTALDFDGANDLVNTNFIMPATSTFSIETWVYPRSTNYDRFISNYASTVHGSIILDSYNTTDNGRAVRFNIYGPGNVLFNIGAANALTLNTWNHIAATFNNGAMSIYVNGFEVANATAPFTSIPQIASNFVFGEDKVIGTPEYLNGKMDEVRFWNKALSQAEIMADMNNCLTGTEANLIAYYNFEDATGTTVSDITASQNNGTMQNMAANDWVAGQFSCSLNCNIEMSQTITIAPVNVDNTTSLNANQITSNQAGATYRWLDCNNSYSVISGETAQTFAPTANGNYAVEITLNGCTDTSACVNLTSVGINNINTSNMSITPNPVKDYLFINGNEQVIKATIYTINGSLVQTLNTLDNKINVSNLSQGMYILVVQTDKGITQNKFIKE